MIFTTKMIEERYKGYKFPKNKIIQEVKAGRFYPIVRGLYEDNKYINPFYIANAIYNPSYISFNSALAYYGMIPEAVYNITCATFNLNKRRSYKNRWGTYFYQDVPKNVYPLSINVVKENGYIFYIASKEKALCDQLYSLSPCKNQKHLVYILFDDMRIDKEQFDQLNRLEIYVMGQLYHCRNIDFLIKYLRRKYHE